MLKSYLARQGLSLESEEVQDEALETSIAAVETAHEEVEETHEEIADAEDGATTLESLVLTFESAPGHRTALEKHLFKCMVAEQYKKIGIATPHVPSLESAEHTYLSMEEEKGVIKKVVDAIKDAWVRFKAMIRDFWAKITDTAGKLNKKFEALKKDAHTKPVVKIDAKKFESHGVYVHTHLTVGSDMKKFFSEVTKKTDGIIDHLVKQFGNNSIIIKDTREGEEKNINISQDFSEELKTPFDKPANATQGNVDGTYEAFITSALELTASISTYRRDWASRDKHVEVVTKKFTDNFGAISNHQEIDHDKGMGQIRMKLHYHKKFTAKYQNMVKYGNRGAAQGIRVAKIILDAVS